jgi:hypothetical protein
MTVPSLLVYFVLVVTAAVAYWSLVAGSTGKSKASFRTELWCLRDEVVDELIMTVAHPSRGALDLRAAIESCIRQSEHFTTFRVFSFYVLWQHAGQPVPSNKLDLAPHGKDDPLSDYKIRLASICTKYLFTNSILGPFTFLLPIAAMARKFVNKSDDSQSQQPLIRATRDVAERPIRVDVQGEAWANRAHDDLGTLASV